MRAAPQGWPGWIRATAIAAFVLVAAAIPTTALVYVVSYSQQAPVVAKTAPLTVRRPTARPAPAHKNLIPRPSDFDQEQRIGPSRLLARWDPLIAAAAGRFAVPQIWIRAVMQIESGGRTMSGENLKITSRQGAMGLMQLMPDTYEEMRHEYDLGPDAYNPRDNIFAAAAYLHWLRAKYGYPTMFAAYNDGPGNLEARLLRGGLLPPETQNYVGDIAVALEHGGRGTHGSMARFTRPNGSDVLIDCASVVSVRAALPDEYAPGVLSVIAAGKLKQGVRENVAMVKAAIRAHGGGI
jgi:soluble lytic murein transglycosylase-like protein